MSESTGLGVIPQPPTLGCCVLTIRRMALRSFSPTSGRPAHAVNFGRNSVAKPWPYIGLAVVEGGDQAAGLAVVEHEAEDFVGDIAVGAVIGHAAVGQEGDAGERDDGHGIAPSSENWPLTDTGLEPVEPCLTAALVWASSSFSRGRCRRRWIGPGPPRVPPRRRETVPAPPPQLRPPRKTPTTRAG